MKKILIVGGGTSGLTIAERLSYKFDVTVLERSPNFRYPKLYSAPLMIGLLFRRKKCSYINKRWMLAPMDRKIPLYESNVLGGASVINGCVHVVGNRKVWDRFLYRFNLEFGDIMEGIESLFTYNPREKGKINLKHAPRTLLDRLVEKVLTQRFGLRIGSTVFSDFESFGPIHNTVGIRQRSSVLDFLGSKKFKIIQNCEAKELLLTSLHDRVVRGIKTNLGPFHADAVILAGGVLGTTKLLLNQRQLSSNDGVRVLSGLGSGVRDHVNLRVNVITNGNFDSLNIVSSSVFRKVVLYLKHWLGFNTLMTTTGATTSIQLDLDKDGVVDTKINILHFSEVGRHGSSGEYFDRKPGFSLSITPIHPKSWGVINIEGQNYKIDPGYLCDHEDVELLQLALNWCLRFLESDDIKPFVNSVINMDEILREPLSYIKRNMYSGHHLVGGVHKLVDENFQCDDFQGLYVCDASIMPEHLASNIHASVVLLANAFAQRFIKRWS